MASGAAAYLLDLGSVVTLPLFHLNVDHDLRATPRRLAGERGSQSWPYSVLLWTTAMRRAPRCSARNRASTAACTASLALTREEVRVPFLRQTLLEAVGVMTTRSISA